MVSHDAKGCSVWLSSKGSLPLDQQVYGAWLRANPFSMGKKSFVFVPGSGRDFSEAGNPMRNGGGPKRWSRRSEALSEEVENLVDPNLSTDVQNKATSDNQATNPQASHVGNDVDDPEPFPIVMPSNTHITLVNFEAQIHDIDME